MRMHREGLRWCQRQLFDLLAHIPRDKRDGGLHFGHHALGFVETLQAGLTEPFLLRNGADRVDVALDISSNQLTVAPHAALQVDKVIGVADGTDALGHRLALPSEALVFVASRFRILLALLQARGRLWGTTWSTLGRLAMGIGEAVVSPPTTLPLRDPLPSTSPSLTAALTCLAT